MEQRLRCRRHARVLLVFQMIILRKHFIVAILLALRGQGSVRGPTRHVQTYLASSKSSRTMKNLNNIRRWNDFFFRLALKFSLHTFDVPTKTGQHRSGKDIKHPPMF